MGNRTRQELFFEGSLLQCLQIKDETTQCDGNLIILIPKKNCDLKKVVSYLNSISFKKNFIYSGRFKIGHRQLSNSIFNV